MLLALEDDLLFSSKIRAVAERVKTEVLFVRTPASALAEAREKKPDLVIVDLDRATLEPIDTIRSIKSFDDLSAIKIVGFASHVHTDLMREAREAGADIVLSRSAFVSRLPDLLSTASGSPKRST